MRLNTLREHYERWERDEVAPTASFWPRLIAFIGGYPFSVETSAELVLKARRMLGLSQYAFGRKVQAIAEDVRKWEKGVSEPSSVVLAKVRSLIADPLLSTVTVMCDGCQGGKGNVRQGLDV